MPAVVRRVWVGRGPTGRKLKRVAYGYSLAVDGKVERRYDSSWTREDAQAALLKRLQERDSPRSAAPAAVTLGELRDRYLAYKRAEGKRSVDDDESNLRRLVAFLGADTPVSG